MKTKLFNLLAVLALTAASSLAIPASADGAYRIGFNLNTGVNQARIGAVVEQDSPADAMTAAEMVCNMQVANGGGASQFVPECGHDDAASAPPNDDMNRGAKLLPAQSFDNACIVAVFAPLSNGGHRNLGIGIAGNCEQARTDARANCIRGDCSTAPEISLNTAGALYLIDGEATACPLGQYAESTDNTDALNCLPATMPEHCEQNDDDFPINNADGECIPRCDTNATYTGEFPTGTCVCNDSEGYSGDGLSCTQIDCGDNSMPTSGTTCMCEENFAGADGMNCMACTVDNASPNENRTACECDSGFEGDGTTACTAIDCGDDSELQEDGKTCMCDANHISPSGEGRDCIFDADSCGSNSSPQTDDDGNTMCVCAANYSGEDGKNCQLAEIPAADFIFVGESGNTGKTATTPIVVAFAETTNSAITLMSPLSVDLTYTRTGESDEELIISDNVVSFNDSISVTAGMYSIFIAAAEANTDNTVATISLYFSVSSAGGGIGEIVSGRSSSSKIALGIASSAAVLMALYFISDVAYDNMHWTPSYAFNQNNGNVSYSVGSRWTATADNWRFYWQQSVGDGEFVYGSGMRYSDGIFAAAMNSESNTDKTDWALALSATKSLGMWNLGGGYNFDIEVSDTETDTKNRLNLSADVVVDGWQLSAAATHESQNRLNIAARYKVDKWILSATANTDGKETAARINYSYRF